MDRWLLDLRSATRVQFEEVKESWRRDLHYVEAISNWFSALDLLLRLGSAAQEKFEPEVKVILDHLRYNILGRGQDSLLVSNLTHNLLEKIKHWKNTHTVAKKTIVPPSQVRSVVESQFNQQFQSLHDLTSEAERDLDETDFIIKPVNPEQLNRLPGLQKHRLVTIQVIGDGSCMFHAIMKAINYQGYNENRNLAYRAGLIETARQSIANLAFQRKENQFTDWDLSLEGTHVVNHMARVLNPADDTYKTAAQLYDDLNNYDRWLGENVIPFLSEFFQVDICLYFQVTGGPITPSLNSRLRGRHWPLVLLLNNDNVHYRVLAVQESVDQRVTVFPPDSNYYRDLAPEPAGNNRRGHADFIRSWNDFAARNDQAEQQVMLDHLAHLNKELVYERQKYMKGNYLNKDLYFLEIVQRLTDERLLLPLIEEVVEEMADEQIDEELEEEFVARTDSPVARARSPVARARSPVARARSPDVYLPAAENEEWFDDDEMMAAAVAASLAEQEEHPEPRAVRDYQPRDYQPRDYQDDEMVRQIEAQTLADFYAEERAKQEAEGIYVPQFRTRTRQEVDQDLLAERALREEQDLELALAQEEDLRRQEEDLRREQERQAIEQEEQLLAAAQEQEVADWQAATEQRLEAELLPTDQQALQLRIRLDDEVYPVPFHPDEKIINIIDSLRLLLLENQDDRYNEQDLTLRRRFGPDLEWNQETKLSDWDLEIRDGVSEVLYVDF